MGILNTPTYLAHFAIDSILNEAGEKGIDGIRYLKNNIRNEIVTPLTVEYEAEILKQTNCKSLDEVIKKLDKLRPGNMTRLADLMEFEKKVIQIADFICEYGLINTIDQNIKDPVKIQEAMILNKDKFIANCHTGFKKGQELALNILLKIQDKMQELKDELKKANRQKDKEGIARIKSNIKICRFKENVLRHLMDMIAWQMIHGQLYISRRLYLGIQGDKIF